MARWTDIPIKNKILENVRETVLNGSAARIENAYVTELGSLSRFPRLNPVLYLPGDARVYLHDWKDDLIAVTGGRTFRIDENLNYEEVTEVFVSGGGRVIFDKTDAELLMAAGGRIVRFAGNKTQILSEDAPETTHIVFVGGYIIAIEKDSGRFYHCANGIYNSWDPLDVFSVDGKPDNLNAAIKTEHGELLLAGDLSIEQYDQSPNGTAPFFKRWDLGTGVYDPAKYTFLSVDNLVWGINNNKEWVAYSTQYGNIASGDIQNTLESVDDWTDAWAVELPIEGHRFILLQIPFATTVYGTKGLTLLYDYQNKRWGSLYGWDNELGLPSRWPGWSYRQVGRRHFVGGEGCIYELTGDAGSDVQRFLWRSGHLSRKGKNNMRVDKVRMRLERGVADSNVTTAPLISLRVNKNNQGFGRWQHRSLGKYGNRSMVLEFTGMGTARTWQFEIRVTDAATVEIAEIEALVTDLEN